MPAVHFYAQVYAVLGGEVSAPGYANCICEVQTHWRYKPQVNVAGIFYM